LHEPVELRPEAGSLAEVAGRVDQVSLAFPPLGASVLEPDLEKDVFF